MLSQEEIESTILRWIPDIKNKSVLSKLAPVIFERISKWSDIKTMKEAGELDFFFLAPKIDREKLVFKNSNMEKTINALQASIKALENLEENDFTSENIKNSLMLVA
ncbi:MAG: hypothetical protein ABIS26_01820, partial [Candidatus Paceibacterota bacterium]